MSDNYDDDGFSPPSKPTNKQKAATKLAPSQGAKNNSAKLASINTKTAPIN